MVGKKEYAQINELLNASLNRKKVLIAVHRGCLLYTSMDFLGDL